MLSQAFTDTAPLFELLRTVRSRRVGLGYRVDSGEEEQHPVTGRFQAQELGPRPFVSTADPVPLSEAETALLAWATCGPNGLVAWEASLGHGFNQLIGLSGRTAPEANNVEATDVLVVDDGGTYLYRPRWQLEDGVALSESPEALADRILEWYRRDRVRILDGRVDLDAAMRRPGAADAQLNGTHQYNLNRPGSTWLLPLTDAGRLLTGIVDAFAGKRAHLVDDFAGGRSAGLQEYVDRGLLQVDVPISVHEQGVLRTSTYPAGAMVENTRLACEALGLGAWSLSGYDVDLLLCGEPGLCDGLGFTRLEAPRAPIATGRRKTYGLEGVRTSTCVPSPRYPTPEALMEAWWQERYAGGAWGDPDHSSLRAEGSPWRPEVADRIVAHPQARAPQWAWDATLDYVSYCVDTYGCWPVTFDPMIAGFGTVVHHVDTEFYDRYHRPGYVTDRIRGHMGQWHPPDAQVDEHT